MTEIVMVLCRLGETEGLEMRRRNMHEIQSFVRVIRIGQNPFAVIRCARMPKIRSLDQFSGFLTFFYQPYTRMRSLSTSLQDGFLAQ